MTPQSKVVVCLRERWQAMHRGFLTLLNVLALLGAPQAQQGAPAPVARQQFSSNTGVPWSGAKVYSYVAGTTTPLATYTDAG